MKPVKPSRWPRRLFFILNSSFLILATSCHKNCVCTEYDGTEHSYTESEVEDRGVSCANMVMQSGVQFYSVCDWD